MVAALAAALGAAPAQAIPAPGSVLAWGCGFNYGQCTVPVGAGSGVTAIAASHNHSLALKSDGSVLAWGCVGEDWGQCNPVPAGTSSGVTAIAASLYHSLALDTTSTTAVSLRAFWVSRTGSGTRLHWRTASETQMVGFNLYRQQRGKLVRLNRTLIPSAFGGTTSGRAYSFLDRRAPLTSRTLRYRLQAVNVDGTRSWVGSASVAR